MMTEDNVTQSNNVTYQDRNCQNCFYYWQYTIAVKAMCIVCDGKSKWKPRVIKKRRGEH